MRDPVENRGIPARFEDQKSASGAFLFEVIADNLSLLMELALITWDINRRCPEEEEVEAEDTEPHIAINGDVIILGNKDIDEFLDSVSGAIGEDIWLDSETAEELLEALEDEEVDVEFEANPNTPPGNVSEIDH